MSLYCTQSSSQCMCTVNCPFPTLLKRKGRLTKTKDKRKNKTKVGPRIMCRCLCVPSKYPHKNTSQTATSSLQRSRYHKITRLQKRNAPKPQGGWRSRALQLLDLCRWHNQTWSCNLWSSQTHHQIHVSTKNSWNKKHVESKLMQKGSEDIHTHPHPTPWPTTPTQAR